ncbi:MAG: glycine/D-amino acid oxidase-like deaminating enzyme [Bacillariaceae sp.]|jgi:glycine/D-amino acid oxidase-like deaminating enzyme
MSFNTKYTKLTFLSFHPLSYSFYSPYSLLHPLNPRGKLAWKGFEGLALANKLVNAACEFENDVILRNKIYRIAMNEDQVTKFQTTANQLPELATWLDQPSSNSSSADDNKEKEELDAWEKKYFTSESNDVLGALRLSGNCKVLHMQSYMKGLWSSCQSIGTGTKDWITLPEQKEEDIEWEERLKDFDCVIFAAGSGLFQTSSLMEQKEFPITLVGGQSIEMTMNDSDGDDDDKILWNAILCGKYVCPMLEKNRVLIGSTHEFKEEPLTPNQVEDELKERSYNFASGVWDNGTIDRITSATRVQSNRGPYGRLPIVGKLKNCQHHPNAWIFTGLSGRGLLYHGLFGDNLVNMILEENTTEGSDILNWWRPKI